MEMNNEVMITRAYNVTPEDAKDDRTIELSFASEIPVTRELFGMTVDEVLVCEPNAVDLSRLNDGAALLFNHKPDLMVGAVKSARVDKDKKCRAVVKFGNTDFAKQIWQDVRDGIVTKVSVGYLIKQYEELKEAGRTIVRALSWQPYEVSLVAIPADNGVGIGRSEDTKALGDSESPTALNTSAQQSPETKVVSDVGIMLDQTREHTIEIRTQYKETPKMNELEMQKAERMRIMDIDAVTARFETDVDGIRDLRRKAVEEGWTAEVYRAKVLDNLKVKPTQATPEIGMSKKEVEQYSLRNAIMSMVPNSGVDARFEVEASNTVARQLGIAPRGIFVPWEVLMRGQRNAYTVADALNAGNLVGTELQGQNFIDMLRNKTVADKVGAQWLTGLQGNVAIPRQKTANTAYWIAENGTITVSTGSVDQVSLSPKILGSYTDYTKKLLAQSTPSIDNFITNDLTTVLALEIDRAVLHGSGSKASKSEPFGIFHTAGVSSSSLATGSWSNIVSLETSIRTANADMGNLYYVTTPTIAGGLKVYPKVAGYPTFVMPENNNLNGYPTVVSSQVATGHIFFGDWSQVLIGMFGSLDLVIDPYTSATSNVVRVIASQMVDVAVRQPSAFACGYGMTYFG